jgi:hypothetical protein
MPSSWPGRRTCHFAAVAIPVSSGRVLATGGVAVLYLHGLGYSLRYLLKPDIWKRSVYAAKTILNRSSTASCEGVSQAALVTPCSNPRRGYAATISRPA